LGGLLLAGAVGGAIGGFMEASMDEVGALRLVPGLAGNFEIPFIFILTFFSGRWIARRKNPPVKKELIVGATIYVPLAVISLEIRSAPGIDISDVILVFLTLLQVLILVLAALFFKAKPKVIGTG
jgi:hypothetical protein